MRIIAGKYRGRKLKTPPGSQTRPTSDRLRETLFNILAPRIESARFLDLCAGTGAVGIEALSRAASHVTFVDQSRKMCTLIEANVAAMGIDVSEFEIVPGESLKFLRRVIKKGNAAFDIVFFDPPYAVDYQTVLAYAGENAERLLTQDGLMIVEHYKKKELPEQLGLLQRNRTLRQGDSALSFYQAR